MRDLLEQARIYKPRNFVFASSSSVYGTNKKVLRIFFSNNMIITYYLYFLYYISTNVLYYISTNIFYYNFFILCIYQNYNKKIILYNNFNNFINNIIFL